MRGYRTISTVLLLCHCCVNAASLALAYTAAQCECNLTYANRQARDKETDSRAEESVANFTRRSTDYLWSATDPSFNLTTVLINCSRNYKSIADFVVQGRLYNIAWQSFISGYNGTNDSKVWGHDCNDTICHPDWVSLLEYLLSDYTRFLSYNLRQLSKEMNYPIGIFRQWVDRSYNYSSYNATNNPETICSCKTTTGYSYSIRFSVAAGNLSRYYYDVSNTGGILMITDIELAIDNFTSYTFNHHYIQSNFDEWEQRNHSGISVFNITLYFKSYHDPKWNTSMSDINNKLSSLTVLQLKHVNRNLTVTQPPTAIECCSYIAGQKDTCNHLTTPQIDTTIIASTLSVAGLSKTAYMNQSTLPPLVPNATQTSPTNATGMENLTNITIVGNPLRTTGSNLSHASQSPIHVPTVTNASHTVQPQTNTVPTTAGSTGNMTSFLTTTALNSTVKNSDHFTNGTFTKTDPTTVSNPTQSVSNPTNATGMENLTNITIVGNPLQTTGSNLSHASQSPIHVPTVTNASHTVQPQTNTVPTTAGSTGNITSFLTTTALNSTVKNSDHFTNGTFTKTDPTTVSNPTQIIVPATRKLINSTATPFDEDPFFKAVVPVVTKVYNDRILLKRMVDGNFAFLTQQASFYTISIPAALGIILGTTLCVVLCQIDWLGRPVQSKNIA